MSALEADFSVRHGGFTLHARFSAPGDGVTALFGPSGAGKSTLLAALAGLQHAKGRIVFAGRDLAKEPPHARGFGLVFQDARLFPHLTARGNILYARKRAPVPRWSLDELAGFFEIEKLLDRRVGHLSGGEKSRVAMARALASAPDYLLLDEPFAALDGARRKAFIAVLLAAHRRFAIPMMVVTHNIDDAAALASHLVALGRGQVVAQGPFASVAQSDDFQHLLDPHDVGAVLPASALTRPGAGAQQGIWLRADHVLVAGRRPEAISARNILEGRIAALNAEAADSILAKIETAAGLLQARITGDAARDLALTPGMTVWALVKAHAL